MKRETDSVTSALGSEPSLYRKYSKEEEKARTNFHYDRSSTFFNCLTGGEWNVYSCNIWDRATNETDSQTQKLNLLATLARLQPGQKILDVGCGWGGPIVYMCKAFGVSAVGLTASSSQKITTEARAAHYGVDVKVVEGHWKDFETDEVFDFIYSDEVLVHIGDLTGFFKKMNALLAGGGIMAHKELHLTHPDYSNNITRGSSFINSIFGETGNYRSIAEELQSLAQAEFEVRGICTIDNWQYKKTIDCWIANTRLNKEAMIAAEGSQFYVDVMKYLKISRAFVMSRAISIDVISSQKRQADLRAVKFSTPT